MTNYKIESLSRKVEYRDTTLAQLKADFAPMKIKKEGDEYWVMDGKLLRFTIISEKNERARLEARGRNRQYKRACGARWI